MRSSEATGLRGGRDAHLAIGGNGRDARSTAAGGRPRCRNRGRNAQALLRQTGETPVQLGPAGGTPTPLSEGTGEVPVLRRQAGGTPAPLWLSRVGMNMRAG